MKELKKAMAEYIKAKKASDEADVAWDENPESAEAEASWDQKYAVYFAAWQRVVSALAKIDGIDETTARLMVNKYGDEIAEMVGRVA